uniref:Uncharacterized protein n=1 Tax=Romanomermis culicivorax TaxID=13658 RepID=A0A915IDX9_ROMCU
MKIFFRPCLQGNEMMICFDNVFKSSKFLESGCQLPSLDDENFLLKKLGLQNNAIYSRFTKCTSNVLKSARTSVEKCAASKLAGLTLPPIVEVKDEPMKQ